MSLGVDPKMESLILTTGAPFQSTYRDVIPFPDGTQARIQFYDSTGVLIARIPGVLHGTDITFDYPSELMDVVPHGAQFQFSVIYPGEEPIVLHFGTAIRKGPRFASAQTDLSIVPQLFTDNFQRPLVGPKWTQVYQSTTIHINTGAPAGLALDSTKYAASGTLWYAPLSGDSVTVNVNVYAPNAGKTGIIVCSNSNMTSYLGLLIEKGSTNAVHIISGTAPTVYNVLTTVTSTTVTNDNFLVLYNSLSDTISVFKNNVISAPLTSRSGINVPHGPGYRYVGASWVTATTGVTGCQLTSWQAQDGVSFH
jgi:hypothetical protein